MPGAGELYRLITDLDVPARVAERTWNRRPDRYVSVSAEITGEADRDAADQRNIERTVHALKSVAESR
ncbi:hypothetical protein DFQ14_104286 [Halopolyspora algeriensis]|uniref:Uncharacterized protein n=1 Tax=Halopolyspora algeriensis TaxID=1500506 RepID=A0A368VSQ3_9ACTN|nr:hypothetical protein [Halopolyspora algeriensis]RCW44695.1 hypothetical protein DFQ14_104286 [Halopolyspora algeriensis]